PNGTFIKWKPDVKVFTDTDLTFDWVKDKSEAVAYSSEVGVLLHNENTDETINYENGSITDYNLQSNKGNLLNGNDVKIYETSSLTHGTTERDKVYVCKADLSMIGTVESGKITCF